MKKAKKLVALTTAAVMAASMLTACGGRQQQFHSYPGSGRYRSS